MNRKLTESNCGVRAKSQKRTHGMVKVLPVRLSRTSSDSVEFVPAAFPIFRS
jgi:hypothetical protein